VSSPTGSGPAGPADNDLLAPVRARRATYARDLGYVRQVLRDGNARANEIASATLEEVRTAMGMSYLTTTGVSRTRSAPTTRSGPVSKNAPCSGS
jgi:hypothetical protein